MLFGLSTAFVKIPKPRKSRFLGWVCRILNVKGDLFMELKIGRFETQTLAFAFFTGEGIPVSATEGIRKYAELNHLVSDQVKSYFATIVVTQHGVRNVTYIQYIAVQPDTVLPPGFRKVVLPEGPCIQATLTPQEFKEMEDGTKKELIEGFLKSNNLRLDIKNVLYLAERKETGSVFIRMPVKS